MGGHYKCSSRSGGGGGGGGNGQCCSRHDIEVLHIYGKLVRCCEPT